MKKGGKSESWWEKKTIYFMSLRNKNGTDRFVYVYCGVGEFSCWILLSTFGRYVWGLLVVWDCEEVEIFTSSSFDHVLVVSVRFVKLNEIFVLFNVYAPCDVGSQRVLWENLSNMLATYTG